MPNYLPWAILCTIFLCTPAGLVGIYFSLQAKKRAARGDIEGSWVASHAAKLSCWVSLALGAVGYLLIATGALRV